MWLYRGRLSPLSAGTLRDARLGGLFAPGGLPQREPVVLSLDEAS